GLRPTVPHRPLPRSQPNSGLPEFGRFIDWPKSETSDFGWRDRGGRQYDRALQVTPSPPLPRKRVREETDLVARPDSFARTPPQASSSDWSEKFTLIPSEPSITVHSRSSKLRSPCTTNGSASAILRAACALAARTMVSPSPRILPSASASGPDANSTPLFSKPIMYSRWRGKCSASFSGAAPPLERTT